MTEPQVRETKLVYIAGRYNGPDYLAIDRNIADAREVAAWCAREGIAFFCPHLNSAHFEVVTPDVPPEFWYALDLVVLRRCDAILMLPGWEQSYGAQLELEEAKRLGLPDFYADDLSYFREWHQAEAVR